MLTTTDERVVFTVPPRASSAPSAPGLLDLRFVFEVARRRARLITVVTLAVLAAVVATLFLMTPRYTATAVLIVDPRQQRVLQSEAVLSGIGADAAAVESQVEVLQSTTIARQVVAQLGLADDPEFNRQPLSERLVEFVSGEDGTKGDEEGERLRRVLSRFETNLRVRRRGLTYVLEVGFVSRDAAKAARIAQAVADAYVAEGSAAKRQATRDASGWLGERLDDLRRRATDAERAVATFRAENNIVATGENRTLDERQVSELNAQLILARARSAEARARSEQVAKATAATVGAGSIPEALQSAVVANLRSQYAETARREAETVSSLGPRHPFVGTVRAQLTDIRGQIDREIARVSAGIRNEGEVAQSRERSLQASLAELTAQSARVGQAGVRLRELEREAQAARTQLEQSLLRFQETSEQAGLQRADARVLSPAAPPLKPSEPKTPLVLVLGLAGALMLGFGSAAVAESLSRGYRTPREIEAALSLPVLATLPLVARNGGGPRALPPPPRFPTRGTPALARHGLDEPLSAFGEALRTVRRRLRADGNGGSQVVVVASSVPNEGKSTVAANLAHAFAKSGLATLLVDADVRKPSIPSEGRPGLIQLLGGEVRGAVAIRPDGPSGLSVLPVGPVADVADASELLTGPCMRRLLEELRGRYAVVVIDAPPVLPFADARDLIALSDRALFVVEWGRTDADVVGAALDAIGPEAGKVAGVLLNKVDARQHPAYGYYGLA